MAGLVVCVCAGQRGRRPTIREVARSVVGDDGRMMVIGGRGLSPFFLFPPHCPFAMPATVSTRQSEAKSPLLFASASETWFLRACSEHAFPIWSRGTRVVISTPLAERSDFLPGAPEVPSSHVDARRPHVARVSPLSYPPIIQHWNAFVIGIAGASPGLRYHPLRSHPTGNGSARCSSDLQQGPGA